MDSLIKMAAEAYQHSIRNRTTLAESQTCGCFHCEKIFPSAELTDDDFTQELDGSYTAICPYCGVDSIISESKKYALTKELLSEMNKQWFNE